jgi:phage terminase small subunit
MSFSASQADAELAAAKAELAAADAALADCPLPPRQVAFIEQYLIDNNATQAAIRVGYSPETAQEQSSRLLSNVIVKARVAKAQAERLVRVNITADTVLHEMSALALANVNHYVIDPRGQVTLAPGAPQNAMAAVQSIKKKTTVKPNGDVEYHVELRLWDKPGSLKLMGKHANVAACFDKVEVTGKDGGPIETITEVRRVVVRGPIVDPKEGQ